MDKIYMIKNLINGKQYIGQTKKTLEQRLARHRYDASRDSLKHLPLYKAFAKYGNENFSIILLEKCDETKANEREQYYIQQYNTYNNGYNATLGGESRNTIQIPSEEIVEHYKEVKSCRKTAEFFGIDKESVSLRVKNAGIVLYTSREQQSKNYNVTFPNGEEKIFHSYPHIAEHLLEINYPLRSKKVESIRKGLAKAFNTGNTYYNLYITKE